MLLLNRLKICFTGGVLPFPHTLGPYGDVDRYDPGASLDGSTSLREAWESGFFERSISMFRCVDRQRRVRHPGGFWLITPGGWCWCWIEQICLLFGMSLGVCSTSTLWPIGCSEESISWCSEDSISWFSQFCQTFFSEMGTVIFYQQRDDFTSVP